MRHLRVAVVGAVLMLATVGVGAASADPVNKNSRYIDLDCEGEIIPVVTTSGTSAHALDDSRTLVLRAATEDGVTIIPFTNGQSKATTVRCVYLQLFGGHQFVIWVSIN